MEDKLGPLEIPANLLKEDTSSNRKKIRNLIKERIDYNKDQKPPLPYRDGLPVGKLKIGDKEVSIGSVTQYARGKGNPTLDTVGDTGKVREGSLLKQTSKTGAVKKTQYGRGARGLAEGMQDHHIRFRTLFEPFYEGLNEKDARELTEWFVQGKSPLGNVIENLEGVDADLHSELERSIHQWAKENQLQVDAFSKEEWQAGARNIDPKTGLVRGGADGELFIDPKKGMATLKAEGARPIPQAKSPYIGGDLNNRKNAAKLYLDTIEEPLLNKTAEILEEQDLRYAANDPNHKPKTKAQWLKKWDESTTAGARTSEWLEDVADKNPNLDVKMSDIDDIIANPDAPLSKAAAKRLKVKPTNSALSALKRIGIGGFGNQSLLNVTPGALAMGALDMFERVLPTEARTIQAREEGFTKDVALGYVKDTALKSTVTGVVSKTLPTLLSAASRVPLLKAGAGVAAGVASSPVTIAVGGGLLLNELVNVVDTYYDGEFKPKLEEAATGINWGGSTGRY